MEIGNSLDLKTIYFIGGLVAVLLLLLVSFVLNARRVSKIEQTIDDLMQRVNRAEAAVLTFQESQMNMADTDALSRNVADLKQQYLDLDDSTNLRFKSVEDKVQSIEQAQSADESSVLKEQQALRHELSQLKTLLTNLPTTAMARANHNQRANSGQAISRNRGNHNNRRSEQKSRDLGMGQMGGMNGVYMPPQSFDETNEGMNDFDFNLNHAPQNNDLNANMGGHDSSVQDDMNDIRQNIAMLKSQFQAQANAQGNAPSFNANANNMRAAESNNNAYGSAKKSMGRDPMNPLGLGMDNKGGNSSLGFANGFDNAEDEWGTPHSPMGRSGATMASAPLEPQSSSQLKFVDLPVNRSADSAFLTLSESGASNNALGQDHSAAAATSPNNVSLNSDLNQVPNVSQNDATKAAQSFPQVEGGSAFASSSFATISNGALHDLNSSPLGGANMHGSNNSASFNSGNLADLTQEHVTPTIVPQGEVLPPPPTLQEQEQGQGHEQEIAPGIKQLTQALPDEAMDRSQVAAKLSAAIAQAEREKEEHAAHAKSAAPIAPSRAHETAFNAAQDHSSALTSSEDLAAPQGISLSSQDFEQAASALQEHAPFALKDSIISEDEKSLMAAAARQAHNQSEAQAPQDVAAKSSTKATAAQAVPSSSQASTDKAAHALKDGLESKGNSKGTETSKSAKAPKAPLAPKAQSNAQAAAKANANVKDVAPADNATKAQAKSKTQSLAPTLAQSQATTTALAKSDAQTTAKAADKVAPSKVAAVDKSKDTAASAASLSAQDKASKAENTVKPEKVENAVKPQHSDKAKQAVAPEGKAQTQASALKAQEEQNLAAVVSDKDSEKTEKKDKVKASLKTKRAQRKVEEEVPTIDFPSNSELSESIFKSAQRAEDEDKDEVEHDEANSVSLESGFSIAPLKEKPKEEAIKSQAPVVDMIFDEDYVRKQKDQKPYGINIDTLDKAHTFIDAGVPLSEISAKTGLSEDELRLLYDVDEDGRVHDSSNMFNDQDMLEQMSVAKEGNVDNPSEIESHSDSLEHLDDDDSAKEIASSDELEAQAMKRKMQEALSKQQRDPSSALDKEERQEIASMMQDDSFALEHDDESENEEIKNLKAAVNKRSQELKRDVLDDKEAFDQNLDEIDRIAGSLRQKVAEQKQQKAQSNLDSQDLHEGEELDEDEALAQAIAKVEKEAAHEAKGALGKQAQAEAEAEAAHIEAAIAERAAKQPMEMSDEMSELIDDDPLNVLGDFKHKKQSFKSSNNGIENNDAQYLNDLRSDIDASLEEDSVTVSSQSSKRSAMPRVRPSRAQAEQSRKRAQAAGPIGLGQIDDDLPDLNSSMSVRASGGKMTVDEALAQMESTQDLDAPRGIGIIEDITPSNATSNFSSATSRNPGMSDIGLNDYQVGQLAEDEDPADVLSQVVKGGLSAVADSMDNSGDMVSISELEQAVQNSAPRAARKGKGHYANLKARNAYGISR